MKLTDFFGACLHEWKWHSWQPGKITEISKWISKTYCLPVWKLCRVSAKSFSLKSTWKYYLSRSFLCYISSRVTFLVLHVGDHVWSTWSCNILNWVVFRLRIDFDNGAPFRELQFSSKTSVRFWSPNVLASVSVLTGPLLLESYWFGIKSMY